MVKSIIRFLLISLTFVSFASFADSKEGKESDYYADYYEDEGNLLFKIRAYGVLTNTKQKGVSTTTSNGSLIRNGYGADTSTAIFFTDHIAAEASLGVSVLKVRYGVLNDISLSNGGTGVRGSKRDVFMFPLTVTGQYHIAPFGAIRPYVGVGYHGAYMFTRAKEFKIKNGYGAVFQGGVDFVAKDDTLINLDIKQYLLKTKITYKSSITNGTDISSRAKINPFVVSVGIGFKF